jgi:hypothetical protein
MHREYRFPIRARGTILFFRKSTPNAKYVFKIFNQKMEPVEMKQRYVRKGLIIDELKQRFYRLNPGSLVFC